VTLATAFFSSGTWLVIRNLLLFFAAVIWFASLYWIYKDAKRRIEDPWLVGMAVLVGVVVPYFGPFIYMLFRPPEYLEDRLAKRDLHCPVCRSEVDASFLVCPICTTKLRQACVNCKAPLEALWQVCPFCETPVEPAAVALPTLEPRRRRRAE
jgi:Double zinc ribbon